MPISSGEGAPTDRLEFVPLSRAWKPDESALDVTPTLTPPEASLAPGQTGLRSGLPSQEVGRYKENRAAMGGSTLDIEFPRSRAS